MSNVNKFSLLDETSTVASVDQKKMSWADMSMDEEESAEKEQNENKETESRSDDIHQKSKDYFPDNKEGKEAYQKLKEFDQKVLSKKSFIEIKYKSRTKDGNFEDRSRNLRVVSKDFFDKMVEQADWLKDHHRKIIHTNNLLELCYKCQDDIGTFVYPVVIIHTKDRDIVRNYIDPKTRNKFMIELKKYYINME